MQFEKPKPQLDEKALSDFESSFRITLPKDYKDFMLKQNGGRPVENLAFDFVETGYQATSSVMLVFFVINSVETTDYDDLRSIYKATMNNGEAPPYLMPIGADPFGNLILLAVAGDDYGKVCFGNHELEDTETGYLVMSPIADSFTEFIEGLYLNEG